uniref:Uncharacterized protein n=1 Tax=Anguilla anguilla TaxID=7936 RepID=A0A0E9UCX6_ANGAN
MLALCRLSSLKKAFFPFFLLFNQQKTKNISVAGFIWGPSPPFEWTCLKITVHLNVGHFPLDFCWVQNK